MLAKRSRFLESHDVSCDETSRYYAYNPGKRCKKNSKKLQQYQQQRSQSSPSFGFHFPYLSPLQRVPLVALWIGMIACCHEKKDLVEEQIRSSFCGRHGQPEAVRQGVRTTGREDFDSSTWSSIL